MQQPITRADVYVPELAATINGQDARLESVRIDRELPDPYAGGAVSADGTIVAVAGEDVTSTVPTPWDPGSQWPPVPESPVSVRMDTGSGPVSILGDGRVKAVDGGTGDRTSAMTVADRFQSLDRPISWEPFASSMPSEQEATDQRLVSLRASAVTDRILRHCGWYATPPVLPYSTLSVPAMGTMWPERGTCLTCARTAGSGYAQMFTEPWGVGVIDVDATYRLGGGGYAIKDRGRIELTAIAGRATGSTMYVQASATGSIVRLSWNDSTAYAWVTDPAGVTSAVVSRSREAGSFLYMTVEYVTDTSVRVILRVDGVESVATVACRSQVTLGNHDTGQIYGEGCGGGFQVAFPSTTGDLASWKPNAVIYDRAGGYNYLDVVPSVVGANCLDLLMEQCKAQAATFWIDETGVLRWWDLARLEAQTPVATLTSDKDITAEGFRWSHTRSQVKRSVTVEWQQPLVEGGWRTNVNLWQGRGSTADTTTSDNPVEDWIKTPDDEVWIMPDTTPSRMGDSANDSDFNYGWGSFYGAVVRLSDGTEQVAQYNGSFITSIEQVTPTAFKLATVWTGTLPAIQRSPSTDTYTGGIWGMRRATDLPILRGKKKYKVTAREYVAAQMGPSTAPDHVIDAGWWIQSEAQAQYTADYAAARLTAAHPVLSSIGIVPLPGLQIGDVVTVTDTAETRLTVRGVVSRDARAVAAGMDLSHAVAIRPVQVSRNGVTWQEWASVARPKTWSQWSTNQNSTWQQWGSDPLGKE